MALDRRRNPNRGPGEKPKDSDARGNHLHTPPHGTEIPGPDQPTPTEEEISASRERLYKQHLFAANHFSVQAQALEERKEGSLSDEETCAHGAFVSGAIFAAAAFLETSITDLYLELQKLSQSDQRNVRRELAMLPRVWPEVAGAPLLHKYQLALSVADADQYNENRSPYFDAESLIRLRDSLLDYTPEWDDKQGRHHVLEKRLFGKFPPNPCAPENSPWFPDRCLSAGCARWAVRAAQFFSDDFCHRMALPQRAHVTCEGP